MKLLLDECVTRHLKRDLAGHEVHTVEEAGFKGLENGDLLRTASGVYEVLITVDRNLPYQQNIAGLNIAILQGRDISHRMPTLSASSVTLVFFRHLTSMLVMTTLT